MILPVVAVAVILVALPIKVYAFATMNKQGWLTRSADSMGGEGQGSTSVTTETDGTLVRDDSMAEAA